MRSGLLSLLLLGIATASPLALNKNVDLPAPLKELLESAEVGSRNGPIESVILGILEELRSLMLNGSDNFPILDPIFIENINIDGEVIDLRNSHIRINDLWIRNIASFKMEEIQFSLESLWQQRYRLDFNFVIPTIDIDTRTKMRSGLLSLLLLGIATASPLALNKNVDLPAPLKELLESAEVGSRNGPIESVILGILEELRSLMLNGSDNFPILDPIFIENINIDGEVIDLRNSHIRINDLWIRNIASFKMEEIQFSLESLWQQRYRLDFNFVIPTIDIDTSDYDMYLNVLGGQVYGTGNMSLQIVNTRFNGHIVVGFTSDDTSTFLFIHESRISFGMDLFDPKITGMFGNEPSSIFVSTFLRNLVREMLDFFQEEITDIISTTVVHVGNIILAGLDLGSLFPSQA